MKTKSILLNMSMALAYDACAAPTDLHFYSGSQFPKEYTGDAFVALHGSSNSSEPAGCKVVRVRFESGQPKSLEDFVTGFLVNGTKEVFGRVVGLAQHKEGSLLVSDDENGIIYAWPAKVKHVHTTYI